MNPKGLKMPVKHLMYLSTLKQFIWLKKWTNTFIRHFPKENILIVSRYNKWSWTLLNITEMQIKPIFRYLLMTIRMTTIKKTQNNCCWEYDKKKTLYIVHKNAHCCNYSVKMVCTSSKIKYIYIYNYSPAIQLLDIYLKEIKLVSQRNISTTMFIELFFKVAKICPMTN